MIANCALVIIFFYKYIAKLSDKDIDVLCMILLAQASGRRKFELLSISVADLRLVFGEKDGLKVLALDFVYVYEKDKGIQIYTQRIGSNTKLERDPIWVILIKLERMGAIKSAVDVWEGNEVLAPDPEIWESGQSLISKMERACKSIIDFEMEQFLENDEGTVPKNVWNQIRSMERPGLEDYRIPFWCSFHSNTGSYTSERMPMSTADCYISKHIAQHPHTACDHGYFSDKNHHIGVLSCRKYFLNRLHDQSPAASKINLQRHGVLHASHSTAVQETHYIDQKGYRMNSVANIVTEDHGPSTDLFIETFHRKQRANYDWKGYWQDGREGRNGPRDKFNDDFLIISKEMVCKQTGEASSNIKLGSDIYCPVIGCSGGPFHFYGDLLNHITDKHKARKKFRAQCPGCDKQLQLSYLLKQHIDETDVRARCKRMDQNVLAKKPLLTKILGQRKKHGIVIGTDPDNNNSNKDSSSKPIYCIETDAVEENDHHVPAQAAVLQNRQEQDQLILVYPFSSSSYGSINGSLEILTELHVGKCDAADKRPAAKVFTKDLVTLDPRGWLSDPIVDLWMLLITRKKDDDVHVFSSFFLSKIIDETDETDKIEKSLRWHKKVDIFQKRLILIPVIHGSHWSLVAITNLKGALANSVDNSMVRPTLLFFDSMKKGHDKTSIQCSIMKWIKAAAAKKGTLVDIETLQTRFVTISPTVTLQDNAYDCGVFTCLYAYALLKSKDNLIEYDPLGHDFKNLFSAGGETGKLFRFPQDHIGDVRQKFKKVIESLSMNYKACQGETQGPTIISTLLEEEDDENSEDRWDSDQESESSKEEEEEWCEDDN